MERAGVEIREPTVMKSANAEWENLLGVIVCGEIVMKATIPLKIK